MKNNYVYNFFSTFLLNYDKIAQLVDYTTQILGYLCKIICIFAKNNNFTYNGLRRGNHERNRIRAR